MQAQQHSGHNDMSFDMENKADMQGMSSLWQAASTLRVQLRSPYLAWPLIWSM